MQKGAAATFAPTAPPCTYCTYTETPQLSCYSSLADDQVGLIDPGTYSGLYNLQGNGKYARAEMSLEEAQNLCNNSPECKTIQYGAVLGSTPTATFYNKPENELKSMNIAGISCYEKGEPPTPAPTTAPISPLDPEFGVFEYYSSFNYNTIPDKKLKESSTCTINDGVISSNYKWDNWTEKYGDLFNESYDYLDRAVQYVNSISATPLTNGNLNIECGNGTEDEAKNKCIANRACAGVEYDRSNNSYCLKYNSIGSLYTSILEDLDPNDPEIPLTQNCDGSYNYSQPLYNSTGNKLNCYANMNDATNDCNTNNNCRGVTRTNVEGDGPEYCTFNGDVQYDDFLGNRVFMKGNTVGTSTYFKNNYKNAVAGSGTINAAKLACSSRDKTNLLDAKMECSTISNCRGVLDSSLLDNEICLYEKDYDGNTLQVGGSTIYEKDRNIDNYTEYKNKILRTGTNSGVQLRGILNVRPKEGYGDSDYGLDPLNINAIPEGEGTQWSSDSVIKEYTVESLEECVTKISNDLKKSRITGTFDDGSPAFTNGGEMYYDPTSCTNNCKLGIFVKNSESYPKLYQVDERYLKNTDENIDQNQCDYYSSVNNIKNVCNNNSDCVSFSSTNITDSNGDIVKYWGCINTDKQTNNFVSNSKPLTDANKTYYGKSPYKINSDTKYTGISTDLFCMDTIAGKDSFAVQDHIDLCNIMDECVGIQYISNNIDGNTFLGNSQFPAFWKSGSVCLKKNGGTKEDFTINDETTWYLTDGQKKSYIDYKYTFLEKDVGGDIQTQSEAETKCNDDIECLGYTESKTGGFPYCLNNTDSSDTNLYPSANYNYKEKGSDTFTPTIYDNLIPNDTDCSQDFTYEDCVSDPNCFGLFSPLDKKCKVTTNTNFRIEVGPDNYKRKLKVENKFTKLENKKPTGTVNCQDLEGNPYTEESVIAFCSQDSSCNGYTYDKVNDQYCDYRFNINSLDDNTDFEYNKLDRNINFYDSTNYLNYSGDYLGGGEPILVSFFLQNKLQLNSNSIAQPLTSVSQYNVTTFEEWKDLIQYLEIPSNKIPILEIKIINDSYSIIQRAYLVSPNEQIFNLTNQTSNQSNEKTIYVSTTNYLNTIYNAPTEAPTGPVCPYRTYETANVIQRCRENIVQSMQTVRDISYDTPIVSPSGTCTFSIGGVAEPSIALGGPVLDGNYRSLPYMVIPLSSANDPVGSITVTANTRRSGASGLFLVIRNPDGSFRTNPDYVNLCPHAKGTILPGGTLDPSDFKSFSHTYTGAFVEDLSCCTLLLVVQIWRYPNQALSVQDATIEFTPIEVQVCQSRTYETANTTCTDIVQSVQDISNTPIVSPSGTCQFAIGNVAEPSIALGGPVLEWKL